MRADTGDEEQPVARDLAHVPQFGGGGRADDEGDVVVMIPADAGARDVPIERLAIASHMLEFRRSRVRCSAYDEDFLVPVCEKRRDGVIAQPGVDSDGIGTPGLEHRVRVRLGRAPHVAALGVKDHGPLLGQRGHRLVEQPAGVSPPSLVERQVELVGGDRVTDCLDDSPHELDDAGRRPLDRWREQVGLGVKAEAEKRAAGILAGPQSCLERHIRTQV